jgi:hypothetical protein
VKNRIVSAINEHQCLWGMQKAENALGKYVCFFGIKLSILVHVKISVLYTSIITILCFIKQLSIYLAFYLVILITAIHIVL